MYIYSEMPKKKKPSTNLMLSITERTPANTKLAKPKTLKSNSKLSNIKISTRNNIPPQQRNKKLKVKNQQGYKAKLYKEAIDHLYPDKNEMPRYLLQHTNPKSLFKVRHLRKILKAKECNDRRFKMMKEWGCNDVITKEKARQVLYSSALLSSKDLENCFDGKLELAYNSKNELKAMAHSLTKSQLHRANLGTETYNGKWKQSKKKMRKHYIKAHKLHIGGSANFRLKLIEEDTTHHMSFVDIPRRNYKIKILGKKSFVVDKLTSSNLILWLNQYLCYA